jgi:ribosomal protein S18 acetylase RimI-like enzyme
MEIVVARDSHVPGMVALWKEFMDFHKNIDPRFPVREDAHIGFEKHLRGLMATEDTLALVALDESRVAGFSVSQVDRYAPIWVEREMYGFIDTMAVSSGHRRQGIGEQMLARILEWFESRGIDRVELSVSARNEVGYSFWRKHGFRDFMHRLYLQRE